jgi:CRP/FNR family transcriptional regulator, anaerobic regulatory protein
MTGLQTYLRSHMGVPEEDMQTLLSHFKPTTLEKGDYYLKKGRICDNLSFHQSGLIRLYAPYEDKEVTQWISFKGNFISDLSSMVFRQPSKFNAQALTHCELFTLDKQDYDNLPHIIPKWPAIERALLLHCFSFMEVRVFSLLSMSANERYQYLQDQNPDLFQQVPLKYLASMMGMTPESLSRIRRRSQA